MSNSVVEEIVDLFRRADSDGNGSLNFDEMRHLLTHIGIPAHEIPQVFASFDTNHDGVVDYVEFMRWVWDIDVSTMERLIGSTAAAKRMLRRIADSLVQTGTCVETLFEATDLDGGGTLTRDEFNRILLTYDSALTPSLLEEAFRQTDWHRDDHILVHEFKAALNAVLAEPDVEKKAAEDAARPTSVDLAVTVPRGSYPGQLVSVEHAGAMYHVPVPAGFYEGSVFITPIQVSSTEEVQVTVPPGSAAGQMITFQHRGKSYEVIVPPGYYAGTTFRINLQL